MPEPYRVSAMAECLAAEWIDLQVIDPQPLIPVQLERIVEFVPATGVARVPISFSVPLEGSVPPHERGIKRAARDLLLGAGV